MRKRLVKARKMEKDIFEDGILNMYHAIVQKIGLSIIVVNAYCLLTRAVCSYSIQ